MLEATEDFLYLNGLIGLIFPFFFFIEAVARDSEMKLLLPRLHRAGLSPGRSGAGCFRGVGFGVGGEVGHSSSRSPWKVQEGIGPCHPHVLV